MGQSERVEIERIITQGGSNGPLIAGVTMDRIAKNMVEKHEDTMYEYKNKVKIPCLEMIDDLLNLTKCGTDSVVTNSYIVTKIETKKLDLNKTKCHQIHVGQNNDFCPQLKAHEDVILKVDNDTYLGDIVMSSGLSLIHI